MPGQVKLPRQTVEWLSAALLTDSGGTHLCPSSKGGHVQQKSISEAA